MPLCVKCNRVVCVPCIRAPDGPDSVPKIYVASDDDLLRKSYFRRLAIASAALKSELELSRREFPDWMADVIHGYEGQILWSHGGVFTVSDTAIDDAFNDDGSFRWLSDFFAFALTPPKQRPHYGVITRLRLIDLAFRIARPDTAQHFGR
tara:strand:- start:7083 stop:7532 length:450 start_codon:yes stop_codon:yes gene_type:complete